MSKKTTTILIVIVLLAMILTGTFAWLQYNQHKTNEANGSGLKYDASLIENFKEIENWKVSAAAVTKEIRVKNSGLTDGTYGDVYVRLQLKEYMEMAEIEYTYSDYRLMIGTDGKFITYATEEAAKAAYPGHSVVNPVSIENTEGRWYVVTEEGDDNGQYGKFLILTATSGDASPLIEDTVRATDAENHDLATNGECAYPVHEWAATPTDCGLKVHEYISWYLGEDVISMDEWDKTPVKKWIYDTTSPEGWVYWGAALTPGETTTNLLEAIKLIKQPNDNFYYAIHTDMEAVSFSELGSTGKWSGVPEDILTALAVPTVKAVAIEAEGLTELADGTLGMEAFRKTPLNFAAAVTRFNGASDAVDWTIKANTTMGTFSVFTESPTRTKDGSTISQAGELEIAAGETAPSLTITATSQHDLNKSDSVTIKLNGPLVTDIEVSGPSTAVVGKETEEAYSAEVKGSDSPSQEVRWEVEESSKSSANTYMDESGILHVGVDETKTTLIVKAISTYDESKAGTMEVTVFGEITLMRKETYAFAATAIGADGTAQDLVWSVDSANSATAFEGNLLTIAEDEIEETLTVTASTYGGTIMGTVTVKVGQIGRVSINETDVTLYRSGKGTSTKEFTLTVNAIYGADEEILWSVSGNSSGDTDIVKTGETTAELTVGSDETSQSLTVTATSTYDPYRSSSVVVKVGQVTSVAVKETGITLYRSGKGTSTQTFTAQIGRVNNASNAVTWSLSGSNGASSIDAGSGALSVGATETSQSLMVTATSTYDDTKTASTIVKVVQSTGVTITTTPATLYRNSTFGAVTQTFAASISAANGTDPGVTWSLSGSNGASNIDESTGKLSVGSTETSQSLTVTATSKYDDTKTTSVVVPVVQATGVTITTTPNTLYRSGKGTSTQTFAASVSASNGGTLTGVTWSLSGSNGASSINAGSGALSVGATETSQSLMVTATSTYDNTKTASTIVKVVQSTGISITTTPATLYRNSTFGATSQTFVASVSAENGTDPGVNWKVSGNSTTTTTIDTGGKLTVGSTETSQSLTVTATSKYDDTKTTSVVVPVVQATGVTISTTPNTLHRNTTAGGSTSQTFAASISAANGSLTGITWSLSGSNGASSIDAGSGALSVGATETSQSLMVTATSTYDNTKTASTIVKVVQSTGISITTTPNTLHRNTTAGGSTTQTFAASVSAANGSLTGITWSLSGSSGASSIVASTGVLTVGSTETSQSLTVTATSSYDSTKTTSIVVKVVQATGVTITTTPNTLHRNTTAGGSTTQTFAASISAANGSLTGITWSLSGSSGASSIVASTGVLTVGSTETSQSLTVTATSSYDSTKTTSIVVKVVQATGVTITTTPNTLHRNTTAGGSTTQTFAASVSAANGSLTGITWSLSGSSGASSIVASTGVLTVGSTETSQSLTVTATSSYDGTKSASVVVPVAQVTGVTISPTTATLQRNTIGGGISTQTFTPSVNWKNNTTNNSVTWSIAGNTSTSTAFSGNVLTIGTDEKAMAIMVTAKSSYDDTKTASAVISIGQVIGITSTNQTVVRYTGTGTTQNIGVTVYGVNSASTAVTWSRSGESNSGTTIDANGVLTIAAAETATTLKVTATSSYDTTKSVTVIVTIETIANTGTGLPAWAATAGLTGTTSDIGKTFTADGIMWKVLTVDGSKNMLIHATTRTTISQFRTATPYTSYEGSVLETTMQTYNSSTALPILYPYMQAVKLVTETTLNDYTATSTGLSYVDTAAGDKTAFALSISEVNSYYVAGVAGTTYKADSAGQWWLRSPGSSANSAAGLSTGGSFTGYTVTASNGVRPALWIKLS